MFNLDRQTRGSHAIVASEAQQQTVEQKQQDVYETHRHRVFSISYYMTTNEVEAEAILTGTFVQAFTSGATVDGHAVDQALLSELEQRYALVTEAAAIPDQGVELHRGQVRRTDMEEAVAVLPPRERLVFLLRDVEGYSAAKIAALLQCDEPEVNKALLSARIRMRNALAVLRARELPGPSFEEALESTTTAS